MWPRRSDALFIGVSSTQVTWQFAGGAPQAASLSALGGQFEQIAAMIEAPSMPARLAVVHVVAGSSVARHWLQTAPPGLRSLSELKALVQSRAEQLFGGDPEWVVAADWHATRPFLCAALPREIDRLASEIARSRGATPHVTTSLSLALNQHARHMPAEGWTVLYEPEALHLLYFSAGRLEYTRTATIPVALQALALEREVNSEVARSAALAGGLPTSPSTMLSMSKDSGATQSGTASSLAARPYDGRTI